VRSGLRQSSNTKEHEHQSPRGGSEVEAGDEKGGTTEIKGKRGWVEVPGLGHGKWRKGAGWGPNTVKSSSVSGNPGTAA